METISKFVSGIVGGGAVSSFLLFVFKGQNKKISDQDIKIKDIEKNKTDRTNCKIIHAGIEKAYIETKDDMKDIKNHIAMQSISIAEIATHLKIKEG